MEARPNPLIAMGQAALNCTIQIVDGVEVVDDDMGRNHVTAVELLNHLRTQYSVAMMTPPEDPPLSR